MRPARCHGDGGVTRARCRVPLGGSLPREVVYTGFLPPLPVNRDYAHVTRNPAAGCRAGRET